jgi:hypothetical protein
MREAVGVCDSSAGLRASLGGVKDVLLQCRS